LMVLDQVASDMTTDQSIGAFGQFDSYIDASDEEDWLSVTLSEGNTETFTLEGLGLLNGSLTLYDANGIEVAYATGPEANALVQLDFDTLSSGQYFIAVSGDFGGTGQYRLRYESDDNDISEYGDDRPGVKFGDVIAGKVNFDLDFDGYTINLTEGQTIYLYVAGFDGLDTYVSLEDDAPFGAFTNGGGLGTDAALSYTAETTGNYNILAGSRAIGTGTYELRISNAPLGTDGNDTLFGTVADEFLLGFAGNDLINGGAGADTLDGGAGIDTLSYAGSRAGVTINLDNRFTRGGDAQGDTFINFENITGSDFGDTLIGDEIGNVLSGGAGRDKLFSFGGDDTVYGGDGGDRIVSHGGDDVIDGGEGNDWMYGQSGDDSIVGGDGNDNFFGGTGTNTMSGDAGNDRFFIDTGGSLDTIDGGDGDDRVVYRNFTTQAVTIDLLDQSLNAGAAAGHTLTNIETIDGTQLADTILGSNTGRDKVFGWDGDDVIDGRDGDDLIWGVDGDDTLNGGAGFDQLRGGSGNDIMDGGDGDDRVTGQSGDDILNGDAGNDDVLGGDGNDVMSGGTGDDFIRGNNGDDVLTGGAGADVMYGDGGADTFVFEAGDSIIGSEDLIRRFEASDTIEIAGHTFVDSNAFSGSGSFEVRYESTAAGTFIEMDRDGDGTADERIDFDGSSVWTFVSDGTDITGVVNGPEDTGAWG
jgi:Ca2+-binding RTX toxin-like protein